MGTSFFTTPNLVPEKAGPVLRLLSVTPVIASTIRLFRHRRIEKLSRETVPFWEDLEEHLERGVLPAYLKKSIEVKSPILITSEAESILNENLAFQNIIENHVRVGNGEMEQGDFVQLYGFSDNEFLARITDYLESIAPHTIVHFGSTLMFPVRGYGVVVGYMEDEVAVACVGILPSVIDSVFWSEPIEFPTIPMWDRFSG